MAYREIKHGTVLEQMNKIRDKMSRDKEFQERIKKNKSLGGNAVASSYAKLISITECDGGKSKDCKKTDSKLCKAWNHNKRYCKYFVNTILTGKGLVRVNVSIGIALLILLFVTAFPHINMNFSIFIWWILFVALVITILIPIHLLYMSEKVGNMLIGKNDQKGLIEKLEGAFNTSYNQYLVEKSEKEFI